MGIGPNGNGSDEFENTRFSVPGLSIGGIVDTQFDGGSGPALTTFIQAGQERDGETVDNRPFVGGTSGRQVEFIPTDRSGLPKQRPTYRGSFIRVGAVGSSPETSAPSDSEEDAPQTFVEDTDRTDDPGGASEETEVLGDDEFLREIATAVVYKIQNSAINEQGFIEDLVFELKSYDNLAGNERQDIRYGSEENVYIFIERYQVPSARVIIEDYVPTSNMPGFRVTTSNEIAYNQQEADSLNKILGSNKTNLGQVLDSIQSIFGSLSGEANLNFENSIITNRLENTKRIKLSSVSTNLPRVTITPEETSEPSPSSGMDFSDAGYESSSSGPTSPI